MTDYRHGTAPASRRMPSWMKRPIPAPGRFAATDAMLAELHLNTVCRSAKCPNRGECYSAGTATFLVLGDVCTRACRFCAVGAGAVCEPDSDEPARVAEAAARMGLTHVVVTMVTRDDLIDGGAGHVAAVIGAVRERCPGARIEVLTSDLAGDMDAVACVLSAAPDVFNHNVETVPRLYPEVRPQAIYGRSLDVLAGAKRIAPDVPTKSGLMVGLGESADEVADVLRDLRDAGVDAVTIGQYLRPGPAHLEVSRFVTPEEFGSYAATAREMGFAGVASAPYVRSSYHAGDVADEVAGTAVGG